MPPERKRLATAVPDLDWIVTDDGSFTLWDQTLQETYHSGCGAVAESLIVYLLNSGVLNRLQSGLATSVLEVGLGTCTNLLLAAAVASSRGVELDYWAVENRILPSELIRQLDILSHLDRVLQQNCCLFENVGAVTRRDFDSIETVVAALLAVWPTQRQLLWLDNRERETAGLLTMQSSEAISNPLVIQLTDAIRLNLIIQDATQMNWSGILAVKREPFDCVFFDAFSPESSPELWTESMLQEMYHLLQGGGTLTSFCVKGAVRKRLEKIGFQVQRLPGPVGGKREVLMAIRAS